MHTLESIHARCEEVGECWVWMGKMTAQRHPSASHNGKSMLVRRRVFELVHGTLPDTRRFGIVTTCGNHRCVNPEHLRNASRASMVRLAYKNGRRNPLREYTARSRARVGSTGSKLTPEIAAAIRTDTRPTKELAAEFACSESLIRKVRTGLIWRPAVRGNSVFNMMGY